MWRILYLLSVWKRWKGLGIPTLDSPPFAPCPFAKCWFDVSFSTIPAGENKETGLFLYPAFLIKPPPQATSYQRHAHATLLYQPRQRFRPLFIHLPANLELNGWRRNGIISVDSTRMYTDIYRRIWPELGPAAWISSFSALGGHPPS